MDDNGVRTESISFDYGTVTSSRKANALLGRKTTSLSLSSEEAGADLFKFLADNLQIEFGLITMGAKGSKIVSSHNRNSVPVSSEAKTLSKKWDTKISKIIHNHPGNTGPSGFARNREGGDKVAAKQLPKADHYVYLPHNSELILYDARKVYDKKKWEEVFPITVKK